MYVKNRVHLEKCSILLIILFIYNSKIYKGYFLKKEEIKKAERFWAKGSGMLLGFSQSGLSISIIYLVATCYESSYADPIVYLNFDGNCLRKSHNNSLWH